MSFLTTSSRDIVLTPAIRRRGFQPPISMLSGLLEWWPLGESGGNRLGSVNSSHALVPAVAIGSVAGLGGANAADFTTSGKSMAIADAPWLQFGAGAFSIALWVYPYATAVDSNTELILFSKSYFGIEAGFYQNGLICYVGGTANGLGGGSYTPNAWYHVTMRRTSSGVLQLWVNGALVAAATNTSNASNPGTALTFGNRVGNDFWYRGKMQAIGLWSRSLTDAEIGQLYAAGAGLFYPF